MLSISIALYHKDLRNALNCLTVSEIEELLIDIIDRAETLELSTALVEIGSYPAPVKSQMLSMLERAAPLPVEARIELKTNLLRENLRHQTAKVLDSPEIEAELEKLLSWYNRANNYEEQEKDIKGLSIDAWGDYIENLLSTGNTFKWPLEIMTKRMFPPRKGSTSIILGARPNVGKTTFSVEMVRAFLTGDEEEVLWLNTESSALNLYSRLFSSLLNCTFEELLVLRQLGKLESSLKETYGDDILDRVSIRDVHRDNLKALEKHVSKETGFILIDMLDNLPKSGDKTHQVLEERYQWVRMIGAEFNAVTMSTTQLSAEADGLLYPEMSMAAESKTGKQGACDIFITIGAALTQAGKPESDIRGIKLCKQKQHPSDMPQIWTSKFRLDTVRARVHDENPKELK